uniref:Uncharacterized protein n=1 Tax=Rhizophora mucronata TaxID=61149 RepID=A0A2P2QV71_RHIMU
MVTTLEHMQEAANNTEVNFTQHSESTRKSTFRSFEQ